MKKNHKREVLVVEDSLDTQLLVKKSLGSTFNVTSVLLGQEALLQLQKKRFDLILLDINLPDINGLRLFGRFMNKMQRQGTPTVFLTGTADAMDVANFLGAADYIVKPFDPLELRLRVESHLD